MASICHENLAGTNLPKNASTGIIGCSDAGEAKACLLVGYRAGCPPRVSGISSRKHRICAVCYVAQRGDKHPNAKPLRGVGGTGVLELVEDFDGDTYRAVYTVRYANAV